MSKPKPTPYESTPTCTPATKKPSPCRCCDNNNMAYYDGGLGYEAYVCRKCGTYFDHEGKHPVEEMWARGFWTVRAEPKH